MNNKLAKIVDIMLRILPIDKSQVIFYSCLNQYNDNPKYVAEKLHEIAPEIKMVWATGYLENKNKLPSYFKQVKFRSLKYLYAKNRSAVVIDNSYGIFSGYGKGLKNNFLKMLKNKKQFNMSTWHGTPYKCLADEEPRYMGKIDKKDFVSTSDILITGNKFEREILLSVCNNTFEAIDLGNPRTDILFNKDKKVVTDIKKKTNLPTEKKIVLFAPTFRDDDVHAQISYIKELDIGEICAILKEKFGSEWVFATRLHPVVLKQIEGMKDAQVITKDMISANEAEDMMEYLFVCDVLITDYSSSIFDIALTYKPCFLYAPDYNEYKATRGLYLNPEQLPFAISKTPEELYRSFRNFDEEKYKSGVSNFLEFIGNVNDGNSSQRAAEQIQKFINKGLAK